MRSASLALLFCVLAPLPAHAQNRLGAPCRPGQTAIAGFLIMCDTGTGRFRYALPSDIPPTPEGGYTRRPDWYPPLGEQFVAETPPGCPVSGRVTFTSPVIDPDDLDLIVPQGQMVGDHVTPIDH